METESSDKEAEARPRSLADRLLSVPVGLLVSIYILIDGIVLPIFTPLSRWVARLALVRWFEHGIANMPPYAVLVLLGVPFALAEPAKILALYWMATDHFSAGLITLIAAYFFSLVVVERIYQAGRDQLMKIRWFAIALGWTVSLHEALMQRLKATAIWHVAVLASSRVKSLMRAILHKGRERIGRYAEPRRPR